MAIKSDDEKTVFLREMYDAVMNNWEGYEDLHTIIITPLRQ